MRLSVSDLQALLQQYRGQAMAIGVAALAGLAMGLLRSGTPSDVAEQNERWRLPSMIPPQFKPATPQEVLDRFWSEQPRELKVKAEPAVAKKVGKWRFIGTVNQGQDLMAVIELENGKVQHVKAGDTLPDDAKITQVLEGEIAFDRQGAVQTARLFVEQKPE